MNGLEAALAVLPLSLRERLNSLPPKLRFAVQEIRLRAGQPVCLTAAGENGYLSSTSSMVTKRTENTVMCPPEWIDHIFDTACECSVYAHQEELRCGYITTRSGCRIGVAGTAVLEAGRIVSYRSITSLCIRVAREHTGCAATIAERICENGRIHSALLCGEPSSGKTSLLKDLANQLADRHLPVAIVDERGELSRGGATAGCDVLLNVPKAAGIEQAVRSLSPRVLIFDELGNGNEIRAVMEGLYRGVPAITSVHCYLSEQLLHRAALRDALKNGAFEYLFFLQGHQRPGQIKRWIRTEEWLREMDGLGVAYTDGHRHRHSGMATPAETRRCSAAVLAADQSPVRAHTLHNGAAGDVTEILVPNR